MKIRSAALPMFRQNAQTDMAMIMLMRAATNAPKQYNCNRDSSQSGTIKHNVVATLYSTLAMP